jgi:hypothetical protein
VETDDYDAKETKFFTDENQRAFIHPSSALYSCTAFYSNFLVYSSLLRTSKLFAR